MAEPIHPDVAIRVSDDNMVVWVDCHLAHGDVELLARELHGALVSAGVGGNVDEVFLVPWLQERYVDGQPFSGIVLMEGVPEVLPVDGKVMWAAPFFEEGFHIDDATGAIDYRERAAQRSVRAGDLLAEVSAPQEGSEGCDVFGRRIHVPKARPARIRAGENVRQSEDMGRFYADKDGRVSWNSGVLSVDTVYRIPGNAGLETGNISHLGAVEIEGDVEQGCRVESRGDIEVKQVVEAADIVCGGSLTVRGGIAGGVGREIRVSGSVHARFILEAEIEAGGDIVVEREIVRSTLKTRGAVLMPRGRQIGGETTALKGIRIGQAGSVASVPTVLCAGEDYALRKEVAEKEAELGQLNETIERIEPVLGSAMSRLRHMTEQKQRAVSQLAAKAEELKGHAQELRDGIEAVRNRSNEEAKPEIEVRDLVYPDTVFCLGNERYHVREELSGPLRAVLIRGRIELRGVADEGTGG